LAATGRDVQFGAQVQQAEDVVGRVVTSVHARLVRGGGRSCSSAARISPRLDEPSDELLGRAVRTRPNLRAPFRPSCPQLLDHIRVATVEQLQWYLDEYRAYWTSERCHQGIDGQTPGERADNERVADVLELSELRRRKLVRRSFAHGLLNGYSLEPVVEAA
jgi:hypothetical protein